VQAIGRQPPPAIRAPDGAPVHYERDRPEQTALYHLVQQHAATFFDQAEVAAGAGGRPRGCYGLQTQVREDLLDRRPFHDRGDDLKRLFAVGAALQLDLEDPLQRAGSCGVTVLPPFVSDSKWPMAAAGKWRTAFCFAPVSCHSIRLTRNHLLGLRPATAPFHCLLAQRIPSSRQQVRRRKVQSQQMAPASRRIVA